MGLVDCWATVPVSAIVLCYSVPALCLCTYSRSADRPVCPRSSAVADESQSFFYPLAASYQKAAGYSRGNSLGVDWREEGLDATAAELGERVRLAGNSGNSDNTRRETVERRKIWSEGGRVKTGICKIL
jgi:hypothetical protein